MKESSKIKIIIVGAGISGLTAGIYAKKSGFDVEIYEKNPSVGGLCTSWVRKGYTIDGCIHWLTGTKKNTDVYNMWQDVGAFKDQDLIQSDRFGTLDFEGHKFVMWNDADKLEEEMLKTSPIDKRQIKKFMKIFRAIEKVDFPLYMPSELMNPIQGLGVLFKMAPCLPSLAKATAYSTRKYAKKFKSPILRYFVSNIVPGRNNLYANIFSYATCSSGNGGVPKGGSKVMAEKMLKTYKDLGGKIFVAREVEKVVLEKKKAVGIQLKNGEVINADYIVSSTDILHTLNKLLERKHRSNRFYSRFEQIHKYPIPSCIYVSYSADLAKYKSLGIGTTYQFTTDEPFTIAYTTQDSIRLREYSFDESFIHNGRIPFNVMISQSDINYPFWKLLAKDRKAYLAEKERIGLMLKEIIEKKFSTLKGDIELLDVVTPVTYHRYCNSSYGGYMSFSWTDNNVMLMHNGKIRGIKNFYVAGQWLQMPGGLPLALASGKFTIQRILKKEKMNYNITPQAKKQRRKENDK